MPQIPSVWDWQLCPARCCSPSLPACTPYTLPSLGRVALQALLQAFLPPQARGCQWSPSSAELWQQGVTTASQGVPSPLFPPNPGTSQLLAGRCGCLGRGGQSWVQGLPSQGESLCQPFPPSPCTLCCWQRTKVELNRADEHLHQSLPYLQIPQESMREAAIRFIVET